MFRIKTVLMMLFVLSLASFPLGCSDEMQDDAEDTLEDLGEEAEDAAEDVEDGVDDMTDDEEGSSLLRLIDRNLDLV
ncbi:hypothetical protein KQI52_15610 [bacterium]|nr:hypothetical protein [bacterium]